MPLVVSALKTLASRGHGALDRMRFGITEEHLRLPRRRSVRSRRRNGHIESLLLVMCLFITICIACFTFEFSKQEGCKAPHILLALVIAQLGFWTALFVLVGLSSLIVKLFQPKEKLFDLFAGCVILGIFGVWALTTIAAIIGMVWRLSAWLLR
jgi:hypothetical protein